MGVCRLFFRGGKNILFAKKHQKDTIFLEKVKNPLFWPARKGEGGKGPVLPSPADAHVINVYT